MSMKCDNCGAYLSHEDAYYDNEDVDEIDEDDFSIFEEYHDDYVTLCAACLAFHDDFGIDLAVLDFN